MNLECVGKILLCFALFGAISTILMFGRATENSALEYIQTYQDATGSWWPRAFAFQNAKPILIVSSSIAGIGLILIFADYLSEKVRIRRLKKRE